MMTVHMYAYTDESGNTGNNLFDDAQPWFWTGTLLSKTDMQETGAPIIQACTQKVGMDLHASTLGLQRIEMISEDLQAFLVQHHSQFVFTITEKRHVATTKFADTLLDSTSNQAVSPIHYWNKFWRQSLTLAISEHFSRRNQEEFWLAYDTGNLDAFCRVLRRVRWNIEAKVTDRRLSELLLDAIDWALQHPGEFPEFKWKRGEEDSPNFIAFTGLINDLHAICEASGAKVARFVHDEQNQFARYLRQAYEIGSKMELSTGKFGWLANIEKKSTYECELEFQSSREAVGLRLADISLWLMSRLFEGAMDEKFAGCLKLCRFISERARLAEFSRRQLARDVASAMVELAQRAITPEDEARARELVHRYEEQRKRRMGSLGD